MTTLEQLPQSQVRSLSQSGDDRPRQQMQQQQEIVDRNVDRQQSAQDEESFTISADDLMMA